MVRNLLLPGMVLGLFLLTGCQSSLVKDINSPFYAPPVGSILELHTPIELPANILSVNIQYGKIQPSDWQLDKYYPNCDFEMREKRNTSVTIQPDRFTVTRVIQDTEHVMLSPVTVAGIGFTGGPPHEEYKTIMYLQSDRQPNVFRMTCQHWEDPTDADHLTIVKIREALGKMFSLEIVGE